MHTLKFRLAERKDIPELLDLINTAYRVNNEDSWTNESNLVQGDRINALQVDEFIQLQQLENMPVQLLIVEKTNQSEEGILGCIGLTYTDLDVEIGTFCIASEWQNAGYGKKVLQAAELYALKHDPSLQSVSIWVLDLRHELIQFYERRGFQKTGKIEPYPIDANVGVPVVDLKLLHMQKEAKRNF